MFAVLAPHPGRTAQLHNYIREAWLLPSGSNIGDVDDDDDEMMIKEQGNYSLRRPPKLVIPQAVTTPRFGTSVC